MCMEDIRIGRKTTSRTYSITTTVADEKIVPYNPNRISLHITVFSANGVPVSIDPGPTANLGLFVSTASGGLKYDVQRDGALVFGPWFFGGPVGGMVGVAETLLADK